MSFHFSHLGSFVDRQCNVSIVRCKMIHLKKNFNEHSPICTALLALTIRINMQNMYTVFL